MKTNEIAAELQAKIADLEAKNTALETRLAALEPKPAPRPRVEESIVRVAEFVGPGEFVMPNSAELKRLRDIVHARYPQLAGEFTGKFAADDAQRARARLRCSVPQARPHAPFAEWRTRRRAFKRLVGR